MTEEKRERTPVTVRERGLEIRSTDDLVQIGQMVLNSGLAPPGFDDINKICVALQYGKELGMSPMMSLQNLYVVNNRPTIFGDAGVALVRASGLLEWMDETYEGEPGTDEYAAVCRLRRKGEGDVTIVGSFSIGDAKRAKLWGKTGPWTSYPRRMLMWRARSYAFRDGFADVLKGLTFTEEARDIEYEVVRSEPPRRAQDLLAALDGPPPAKQEEQKEEPEVVEVHGLDEPDEEERPQGAEPKIHSKAFEGWDAPSTEKH